MGKIRKSNFSPLFSEKNALWVQGYYTRRARVRIYSVLRSKRLGSEWKACKGQKERRARVRFKGVFHKGVRGLETANVTFLHIYILHFYMRVCLGVQNMGLRRLIFCNIWTRDG